MIEILNLGLNNLGSLTSAMASCTREPVRVVQSSQESDHPRLVILPGTGSFGAGMRALNQRGFHDAINFETNFSSSFIVGICLGMQLLAERSEEAPGVHGIGLVKGAVKRLPTTHGVGGRVPHVGWAELEGLSEAKHFSFGGQKQRDVYFSHSYHLELKEPEADVLRVNRGNQSFVGAFRKDSISGYQFHPEKSSTFGLGLLSEMLRWAGIED